MHFTSDRSDYSLVVKLCLALANNNTLITTAADNLIMFCLPIG
jgi:hypothetical protein